MNESTRNAILALLAGTEAPAPEIPNGIRANHTYDFVADPFASNENFTFLGHIPGKSSRDIRPAIILKDFPVTDYPVLLTDLSIFEDFLGRQ